MEYHYLGQRGGVPQRGYRMRLDAGKRRWEGGMGFIKMFFGLVAVMLQLQQAQETPPDKKHV